LQILLFLAKIENDLLFSVVVFQCESFVFDNDIEKYCEKRVCTYPFSLSSGGECVKIVSLGIILLFALLVAYGCSAVLPLVSAGDEIPHPKSPQPTGEPLNQEPTGDPIPHPKNITG
jgi:hypothetical protein